MELTDIRLGVLGGGQLGKMLLAEARKWDLNVKILDPNENAPSKINSNELVLGDFKDYETVINFAQGLSHLTIEIENVNTKALFQIQEKGVKVYPSPKIIELINNKCRQKEFYTDHAFVTSDFKVFKSLQEAKIFYLENENRKFVWKIASGGYDGKGVQVIKLVSDFDNLPEGECLLEELVNIKTECAVIIARDELCSLRCSEVLEQEFDNRANLVRTVFFPSKMTDVCQVKMKEIAIDLAEKLNLIGLLAVEFFIDENDTVWINEIAPRTHNSGHLTIEASYCSQFEQHLRAILGLGLGDFGMKVPFACMVNLYGEEGYSGEVNYEGLENVFNAKGASLHLYGKEITKPFRKMGHVTIVGDDLLELEKNKKRIIEFVKVKSK